MGGEGGGCPPRTVDVGSEARGGAALFDGFDGVETLAAATTFAGEFEVARALSVGATTCRDTDDIAWGREGRLGGGMVVTVKGE